MADEGEIDVLGDFDLKLEADSNIYDSNELPSKSANLLPEFTDPPWMLEQGWTLDNSCMDEKSKATIEKMLLEEQYYITGKSSRAKQHLAMSVGVGPPHKKKIVWTQEEKDMFHKGMEIYGRSWTKIAELIPTRTSTQIKNFAHQLFRTLNKDNKDISPCKTEVITTTTTTTTATTASSSVTCEKDPLTITMATITTASPTIKTVKKSVVPKRGRIPAKEKLALQTKSTLKQKSLSVKNCKNKVASAAKKVSRMGKPKDKGKVSSKVLGSLQQGDDVNRQNVGQKHLSDMVLDQKLTITPSLIENLEGFCAVADIISGEKDEVSKTNESDDDIDVDIENDDDSDSNPFLIGRSTSPNSVYEKLLIEANLNESVEAETHDKSDNNCDRDVKTFLEWKTCESQKDKHEEQELYADVEACKENTSKIKESKECTTDLIVERAGSETNDTRTDMTGESEPGKCEDRCLEKKEDMSKHIDSQKVLVNALLREDGETVHFPAPTSEVTLQPKIITDQEKDVLKEFFENRLSKTPERYLKIRNYIIESWKKCRPGYLNKTSVRSGLKNCGDVNGIGRVHSYLECIGAINFGCDLMGERAGSEAADTGTDVASESEPGNCEDRCLQRKEDMSKHIDSQKVLVNALLREDGETVHFPVPTSEVILQPKIITDQEKEVLKEFFENRLSKTPERYLKIRNYIIESWKKCRPGYLNKTSIRSGLKNCGDVNSIGRVHSYLECIGAINFGCEQTAYKHPRSIYSLLGKEKVSKDFPLEVNSVKRETMRPRKRKVKDAFGFWIDEKDLEGVTFEHGVLVESRPKETKQKQSKTTYDPFKLIPCLSFTDDNWAPFLVEIHCSALIVMDIHSHISKTEVIGMLGGKFFVEQGKLTITMATPCNSISTGMQCEMDPVSQTQASEEIRGSGMDVVGWYHSHPSFAPNPSVRDIETQLKFQDWFSKGGSNFVGVIVSPYNPRCHGMCSEVNCLTVSEEVLPQLQCNIPYKFSYTTRPCDISEINHIMLTAQDLATSYSSYPNRVNLASTYSSSKGITCLEKMLESLKAYCPEQNTRQLLESVRKAFTPVGTADHVDISNSSCDTSDNLSTDS